MPHAVLLLASVVGLALAPPAARPAPAQAPAPTASRAAGPRPGGTVLGTLRHHGCPTVPTGAVISVIGRDASVRADAEGRFSLALPPGTYSLVITGPGLVPDQRVDDVPVGPGEPHDLGTVEVWPEEPPPGCAPGWSSPPVQGAVVATASSTPTLDLPGSSAAPAAVAPEQVWVRGGPGTAPGQFGLLGNPARDDEDALGPSTLAVGPQGNLWVLDAVNARVQRFDGRGHPAGAFPVEHHGEDPAVEADLAVSEEGHVFVFHQNEQLTLSEYDPGGRLLLEGALPPAFKGVDLLFARVKPLFLMLNGQVVRAELGWGGIRSEGPLPGLPFGGLYARADREDRWRVVVTLAGADGRVRRTVQLRSWVPVTGVRLVGVERRGELVLAIDRAEGDEGTPRAEVLLVGLDPHGNLAGTAQVPPGNRRFEFREFTLAPDGTVVQLQSDAGEVRVVRWTLHPPPRPAGQGLVRGKVMEGGRPVPGALVTLSGRERHTVIAGPDGGFEVVLPAGAWGLTARRPGGAAQAEAQPDLHVAVAVGASVDLGAVPLAAARGREGR